MSDNRDEVFAGLNDWAKRMDDAGFRATQLITRDLVSRASYNADQVANPPIQKNGKLRYRPHIGPRTGEGPNHATGNLLRNIIGAPVRRQGFETYVASATSGAEYSYALEKGSTYQFPFMTPARDYLIQSGRAVAFIRGEVLKAYGG
jgi:hypothetical protein